MKRYFAKRTDWPSETNALMAAYQRLKEDGVRVIDLTVSNPTQCSFPRPEGYLSGLSQDASGLYEPAACGHDGAREAICDYYAALGCKIGREQIVLTSSTSEAYSYIFRLLADFGDHVLFPQPSYPLFSFLGDLNDIVLDRYRLVYERQWRIDIDDLRRQLTDHTKAIVCLNPNNPTGSYIGASELVELNRIAQEKEVPLICDEVFWDFTIDEGLHPPTLAGNNDALSFTLGGLSKLLGLPQMKLSWIVVSGPESQRREALHRLEILADTYLSVNTPVQTALAGWLAHREEFQRPIKQRVRGNFSQLTDILKGSKSCSLLKAQGGWYAIVKVGGGRSEEKWALKLLNSYHIFVHPGYFFDFEDEGYFVISLLGEPQGFKEGVSRLVSRIEQEVH